MQIGKLYDVVSQLDSMRSSMRAGSSASRKLRSHIELKGPTGQPGW